LTYVNKNVIFYVVTVDIVLIVAEILAIKHEEDIMASTFGHIYWAEQVYKLLSSIMPLDYQAFMIGNLIPDLATNKKLSHYRIKTRIDGFLVPDLVEAKKDLLVPNNPVSLGLYSHLSCDKHYITHFLIPSFIWDISGEVIINPKNNKTWDKKTFFSNAGIYGAYSEITPLLIKDNHVSLKKLEQIPKELPLTGIPVYDTRKNKLWNEELDLYYSNPKQYTGDIIDYPAFCKFIEECSKKFVNEIVK